MGLGLGGPRALSVLGQIPLQRFYQNGKVPCGVCQCEAWPRGIVSSFGCSEPRGANEEFCAGVQIANQCDYDGYVLYIQCCWPCGPIGSQSGVNFWVKGEPPVLDAFWLAPSAEKDVVVLGIYCDSFFLKKNMAVMVA